MNIVIAGAGPAGASLAIRLGRAGHRVSLFDKATALGTKACGEGLMPKSLEDLADLGVLDQVEPESSRFHGIAYVVGKDRAEARFPGGSPGLAYGLGVPREVLDPALVARARQFPSVSVHLGVGVRDFYRRDGRVVAVETDNGELPCDVLVAADGRRSRLRRRAGLDAPATTRPRGALVSRMQVQGPRPEVVEVHLLEAGEAYLTPTRDGWIQVVICLEQAALKGLEKNHPQAFHRLLSSTPATQRLLDRVSDQGPVQMVAGLNAATCSSGEGGLFLAGDAGGFVDPVTGEGTSLALADSRVLASLLGDLAQDANLTETHRAYAAGIRCDRTQVAILTHSVLALTRWPRVAHWVVRRLGRRPALLRRLVAVAAGRGAFGDIRLTEALSVLVP